MKTHNKIMKEYEKNGLIILKKVLKKTDVNLYKKKIFTIFEKIQKKNKILNNKTIDINAEAQAVHNLHNKDIIFLKLLSNKKVLSIVEKLLKASTYLNSEDIICQKSFARNPSFKKKKQILHTDSRFISSTKPLTINVFWLLDNFTKFNGHLRNIQKSKKYLK